jgi:hypothetical protein
MSILFRDVDLALREVARFTFDDRAITLLESYLLPLERWPRRHLCEDRNALGIHRERRAKLLVGTVQDR